MHELNEAVGEENGPDNPEQVSGPRTDEGNEHGAKRGAEESE